MTQFDFPITERHLEDKSKLVFQFNLSQEPKFMIKTLNFMENIQIDERVSTNYAQYTPIGSNGSQFAYLGTKSREFEISFNITLPHIMESTLIKPEVSNATFSKTDKQNSFFTGFSPPNKFDDEQRHLRKFIFKVDKEHRDLLTDQDKLVEPPSNPSFFVRSSRDIALTKIMFWVNLIRSSCITSSRQPYLGPPLVRLHHGILYSDIPCLVNSYNITYDQMNGFDAKTMLPRVISVKLSLKEVRLRGKVFSPGDNGDYMPGWDSMFVEDEFVTLDPNIPRWSN